MSVMDRSKSGTTTRKCAHTERFFRHPRFRVAPKYTKEQARSWQASAQTLPGTIDAARASR